jgi:hypothetical protein
MQIGEQGSFHAGYALALAVIECRQGGCAAYRDTRPVEFNALFGYILGNRNLPAGLTVNERLVHTNKENT